MTKRALIVAGGGLEGAYSAGALSTLCRKLGSDYFNVIYAISAGAFESTFYVANQPDTMENTWRNLVDAKKLVNFSNIFSHSPVLNLDYLTNLFQSKESWLDQDQIFKSKVRLHYVLTNKLTGKAEYVQPKPGNIFACMWASSAVPLFHKPVSIDNKIYFDGCFSDPLPFKREFEDGCDEILIVSNAYQGRYDLFSYKMYIKLLFITEKNPVLKNLYKSHLKQIQQAERDAENNPLVKILRPSSKLALRSMFDTNKARLNKTVDLGKKDAEQFLKTLNTTSK